MIRKVILAVGIYCCYFQIAMAADSHREFYDYVLELQQQALNAGVTQLTVERNIPKIKIYKKANVKNVDSQQTLDTYIPQAVPEITVSTARALFQQHSVKLQQFSQRYGVQSRFLVALWGIESSFGEKKGDFPALSVLASLAYKGSNESFYIQEFIAALKLIDQYQLTFEQLLSTSTGAMGQMKMMPSQLLKYAIDADHDGSVDVWTSIDDAFASAANMLSLQGWKSDTTWGRQVKSTIMLDPQLIGLTSKYTFSQWHAYGIRRFNGDDLPERDDMQVSLIAPDGVKGRYYLVYDNFILLNQFSSTLRNTLAVTYLSEKIKQ